MSTAQEVAETVKSVHVQSVPGTPPQQCASSNPGETGAASRTEPHQHPPRKVRGIDGTGRPRHPAVYSQGEADLRPR